MKKKRTSEFGQGLVYCLVLFAKHHERMGKYLKDYGKMAALPNSKGLFTDSRAIEMWFNGAADHFFELNIPVGWKNKKVGKLALELQERGLHYRMLFSGRSLTLADFNKFFEDLELLARLIDKELGVKTAVADFR